jgi:hypothetical protein
VYEFAIADKLAKGFELCHSEFEGLVSQETDGPERSPVGKDASTVGLKIKLVRNDGIFSIDYEDKDGSIAEWTFEGLQEMGNRPGIYASAGTQTCIASFVVKGVQTVQKPVIDEKCDAFIRSKGAEITSFLCTASDGSVWNVSAGGVAKRLRRELNFNNKSFV